MMKAYVVTIAVSVAVSATLGWAAHGVFERLAPTRQCVPADTGARDFVRGMASKPYVPNVNMKL